MQAAIKITIRKLSSQLGIFTHFLKEVMFKLRTEEYAHGGR